MSEYPKIAGYPTLTGTCTRSKPFQYHALGVKPSRIPSTEKYTIEKNETMTGMPEATHDWCFSAPHHSHLVTPLSDQPKLEPASTHASYEFFPIAITKKDLSFEYTG